MTKQEFWELIGRMVNISLKSCKDCPINKDIKEEIICNVSCGEALHKFYKGLDK